MEIHRGAWRVHGILSVSRSIGDAHLKDWVLAEPDTMTLNLDPDMEYLVLASDGLWEEVRKMMIGIFGWKTQIFTINPCAEMDFLEPCYNSSKSIEVFTHVRHSMRGCCLFGVCVAHIRVWL